MAAKKPSVTLQQIDEVGFRCIPCVGYIMKRVCVSLLPNTAAGSAGGRDPRGGAGIDSAAAATQADAQRA